MSWDPVAGQIHGISRSELKHALPAHEIARQLNQLLGPCRVAYCNGWNYDTRWSSSLYEKDPDYPVAHRAGADAEQLLLLALNAQKIAFTTDT